MKISDCTAKAVAARRVLRSYGAWIALFVVMLFTAVPGTARAATCAIDFSVAYNAPATAHVMSMTSNFDEFAACDPRYIANPGDPASGFTPYVQIGSSANGGSFSTQVNAADDTLTYTPPTGFSGVDTFVVYFCGDVSCTIAGRIVANVSVTVAPPPAPVANAVSVTFAANSSANPVTLAITGGTPTSVATPGPPIHGTASVAGTAITYTPMAGYSGPDSFTYTATNLGGTSAPATVSVTVSPPTLTLSAITPTGQVSAAYGSTIVASLGTAPYSYAVTVGALPAGIAMTPGGVLSGTPTTAGAINFTVTATDLYGATGAQTYSIVISPPTVAITSPSAGALPSAEVYASGYSQTFSASGGQGAHSFALAAGALPPGMSFTSGGVLSGTPTTPGTYNFSVTPSDSSAAPGPYAGPPVAYSLTVTAPAIALSPAAGTLTARTTALTFSETFTATGGVGPYSYSLTAGALPPGVSLASGGVFSGTPTAAGTYSFSITADDANGFSATNPYTVVVSDPVITVTAPTAGALPSVEAYASGYSQTFTAAGGSGAHSFALTAGALPPGMSFTSGGALSGTPTTPGTYNFSLTASDSSSAPGPFTSAPVAYSLTVTAPTISFTPTSLSTATTALALSETFTATGGVGPYSYSLTAGALPPGVSLASGGVFSGTPTAAGTYSFSITAADANGFSATNPYTVVVSDPVITVTAPTAGALPSVEAYASGYSQTFTAAGGSGAHSFALTAGALPPGMSFTSGGVLSGTPTTPGTYNFSLTASDSSSAPGPFTSAPVAYSLTVTAPTVVITSPAAGALPGVVAFGSVNQTFTAVGGSGPHTFALVGGALPAGVSLSSGGVLSGAPTTPGTYNFSIAASDSSGAPGPFTSAPIGYSLVVTAPTISFTPATLSDGTTGQAYAQTLTASGGAAAYGYGLTAGALPSGIALAAGGSLSGTPTAAGTFDFTITVTDANGFTAANTYSLLIIDAAPVAQPDPASTLANQAVAIPVTDNDSGVISSIVVTGAPAHGAVAISGLIPTYTPTLNYFGADSFTYTATGPGGTSAPATVSITVVPLAIPTAAPKTMTVLSGQSASLLATDGSTGAPITAVAIAVAPANGTVVVSGQDLIYTPGAAYSGADSFTYTLANPFGTSAPATVTVTVNPAPATAAPITVEILAGQTASVSLTANATGGPFTAAALVSLSPSVAGTSMITNPAAGQYGLTFTPAGDFAGTVTATYTLSNAFATSAAGTVTVIVTARPDPGADPEVIGLIAAQNESARRFATAQIANVNSRLESLRDGGGGGTSLRLNFSGGSRELDEERDPLRRRLGGEDWPDVLPGMRYAGDQMDDAGGGPAAPAGASAKGRFGLWAAGGIDFGQRDATTGQRGVEFDTDGLTAGADLRISDQVVLGASVGWGHDESRVGNDGTRSDADGYSYAVYGSFQPGSRFFVDGVFGYGSLNFESRRYITASGDFAYGERDGSQWFGAVTGGWDMRDGRKLLSPYGRLSAARSELGTFTETTGGAYALGYESQTARTLTGTFGLRGAYSYLASFGEVMPRFRLEYSHDFQGADRANLFYVDWVGGPIYGVETNGLNQNRALGGVGLDVLMRSGTRFSFEYELVVGNGAEQHQTRLQIQTRF